MFLFKIGTDFQEIFGKEKYLSNRIERYNFGFVNDKGILLFLQQNSFIMVN